MDATIKCTKGYDVIVLSSYAGYYIGTLHDGEPNCRLSQEYYPTKDKAEEALKSRTFTERNAMENEFCNGYSRCIQMH